MEVHLPFRATVEDITATRVSDMPSGDLDATQRTLDAVTRRAAQLLSAGTS